MDWILKGCEEDFPQGIPQDFVPCGSCVSVVQGDLFAMALHFLLGAFPTLCFSSCFLEEWFWHLCALLGYNLCVGFRSVLQQVLPPGCFLIVDVVFSCPV